MITSTPCGHETWLIYQAKKFYNHLERSPSFLKMSNKKNKNKNKNKNKQTNKQTNKRTKTKTNKKQKTKTKKKGHFHQELMPRHNDYV